MTENTTSNPNILGSSQGGRYLGENVLILPAQGNGLAVKSRDSVVVVDAGPGGKVTRKMIAMLRDWTDLPVQSLCYSHGHPGYNDGIPLWLADAEERGHSRPMLVAQENLVRRYDRYRETSNLQNILNRIQFPQLQINQAADVLVSPTVTFKDRMVLSSADQEIILLAAPSETDDVLALWLPQEKILYAGAALPGTTIPNIGTPLRTQRLTIRWAETLEMMADLKPEVVVTEFGDVIEGVEQVSKILGTSSRALRWMREQVVTYMNQGLTDLEIIHTLQYPDELFDWDWMRERYGAMDYIVRDIYREENGWWDRNATSLHPAHPDEVADAIAHAITDKDAVLAQARLLVEQGNTQLAMHVVDLLALVPGDDPRLQEARSFKAELCSRRGAEVRPYVSKALFESYGRLIASGRRRWSEK